MPLDTIPNFKVFDFPVGCPPWANPHFFQPPEIPHYHKYHFGKQFCTDSLGREEYNLMIASGAFIPKV